MVFTHVVRASTKNVKSGQSNCTSPVSLFKDGDGRRWSYIATNAADSLSLAVLTVTSATTLLVGLCKPTISGGSWIKPRLPRIIIVESELGTDSGAWRPGDPGIELSQ